jgi:hypothetical protein
MNPTLLKLRVMKKTGAHLYGCFASKAVRARGWKMIQDAKRAARRLGVEAML